MNPKIIGAFVVGAGLILSAYYLTPADAPTTTRATEGSLVAEAPKRVPIDIGDTDNDGIPDWQEEFRTVTPVQVTESALAPDTTEPYYAPETLTGQIAVDLLSETIRAQGYGPLGPSPEDILSGSDVRIRDAATDALYTHNELTITQTGTPIELHAYSNRIAEIIVLHLTGVENEIEIIQAAVYGSNPDELARLTPLIDAYTAIRNGLLTTPVPADVASDHLNLLNAFNAVRIDIAGMAEAYVDPMYTVVRLQRYYDDVSGRNQAIINLYEDLKTRGVVWSSDDIAAQLIDINNI